jgi:hypothetical protein
MNHEYRYNQIIMNAMKENRRYDTTKFYERHHIIPKCCGGSDSSENLIYLKLREHFICHGLLAKMSKYTKDDILRCKLETAYVGMGGGTFSSRTYEKMRKLHQLKLRSIMQAKKEKGHKLGRKTNLTPQVEQDVLTLRKDGTGILKIGKILKLGTQTIYKVLEKHNVKTEHIKHTNQKSKKTNKSKKKKKQQPIYDHIPLMIDKFMI